MHREGNSKGPCNFGFSACACCGRGAVFAICCVTPAALTRAASKDKMFHIVEGANHMSLYDVSKYVDEAVSVLVPFFQKSLSVQPEPAMTSA